MTDPLANQLDAASLETKRLEAEVAKLSRKASILGETEKELAEATAIIGRLERELGILEKVGNRQTPPNWLKSPPKRTKQHHAIPWLLLSDLHLDEVVEAAEVMGVNSFNRKIAKMRLEATALSFVKVCRDYWSGITYDGVVVCLGGDLFSGDIHEELKETNEDTILGSLDYWIDPIADVLRLMADEFGSVHVPVVVGNHGRMTRKPRAKFRARSNFDWFMGKALQRLFANDPRVTFDIAESADCLITCYDHKIMLTHGDQTRGGGGIGGIWPPLMRLDARKRQRQEAVNQGYELLIMGHWHQLVFGPSFIVNGSLKGYDEYAFTENFGYEPPQQAAWLMTPEHGITWRAPILCQDRKKEGW
jgi:UDP-2,3-diacylglucosamine pyrophosphatase LpxH